jgi:hypothetical protein
MAIKLVANYAKRLGLPGYSSHQFSVSVETELHDVDDITGESARLYTTLQKAVDEQIQQTGFVPPDGYGMNGAPDQRTNGSHSNGEKTSISAKQLDLINKIVKENNVKKDEVERLSMDMFGVGVSKTNRMQASNLIDALFEQYGRTNGNGQRGKYQQREQARS